jgi:lipid A 3-O-deacylase
LPTQRLAYRALLAWLALASLFIARPARAQIRAVSLVSDNDAFDFWIPRSRRPDHDYTNGVGVRLEVDGAPLWGRALAHRLAACGASAADERCTRTTVTLGQKMYTPGVLDLEPVPGERPYAGWLYGEVAAAVQGPRGERELAVQLGVTGPPSLAGALQTTWHHLAGFYPPRGWDQQLPFEPAFLVRYGQRALAAEASRHGVRIFELVPGWAAEAGTLRLAAEGQLTARAGFAVPHPWAHDAAAGPVSIYLLAGLQGDAVARDLFLDGDLWHATPHAERRPLVWERSLGAAARYRSLTLEYRAVTRGREYQAQPEPHTWGSFTLAWRRE